MHYSGNAEAAEQVAAVVRAAGARACTVRADLSDADAAARLVDEVEQHLGPVDVLVPNAGVGGRVQSLEEVDLDTWQRTLAVNLTAPFVLCSRTLPGMAERGFGRVLLVSSVAAFTGGVVGPHYAASKAGLHGMLYWLAARYADRGVTINAIAPALVVSGMIPEDQDTSLLPVGRLGQPDEVAELAMAMLRNAYLTGKVYLLDGGMRPQ